MSAAFEKAFEAMIRFEGGYRLHTVPGDAGGMTYAGVARNRNPQWPGWSAIDRGETPATGLVRDFYAANYWAPIRGDELPEPIAASIFDFAVNAGVTVAAKLAQIVAGCTPDGHLGLRSVAALSAMDPDRFRAAYALAKIKRYVEIVGRNRSQGKFLLGWISRALEQI